MPLIEFVLKPLAKSVLIPLGLTVIHKNMFRSGRPSDLDSRVTILIISNEEMNEIIKIVKSLEESGLLIERVSETIRNEAKEQK